MNNDDHLIYVPPPQKPYKFDERLRDITGINAATGKPWLRFVWGMDRLEFNFGEMIRRYPCPDDHYVGMPRWILEGWQSPGVLDRAEWEEHKTLLGPFPANGTYDFIAVHRTNDYKFLHLSQGGLDLARSWRFWKNKPKKQSVAALLEQHQRIRDLKAVRFAEAKAKIYDDMIDDMIKAEDNITNPAFSIPGQKGAFEKTAAGLIVPTKSWN